MSHLVVTLLREIHVFLGEIQMKFYQAEDCCFLEKKSTLGNNMPIFIYDVPWASCQIRKTVGCACAGNAGNVFSATDFKRKPLYSDHGMHHGTCVTHVPWCMSGSLTHGGGENVPGIPGACATRNFTYLVRGPLLCSGLLSGHSGGTKPLSEPILTYQQSSHVTFTSRQSRFQIF